MIYFILIIIDNNYTGDLDGEEIPEIENGLVDGKDIEDIDKLLKEPYHECRLTALLFLVNEYKKEKTWSHKKDKNQR